MLISTKEVCKAITYIKENISPYIQMGSKLVSCPETLFSMIMQIRYCNIL